MSQSRGNKKGWGRNEAVSIIMFEIRAIMQWNKDIKNDVVGHGKVPLFYVLKSCSLMLPSWHRMGAGRTTGRGLLHNLMLTGFIN